MRLLSGARLRAGIRTLALALLLLGTPTAPPVAGASFEAYLWETHVPGDLKPAARPLLIELRRQIDAVLDAGHLAPLRFSGADQVAEGFYLYTEPGRILNTLGNAYPYLSADQQARVRSYVREELANPAYTPWSVSDCLPPEAGSRREWYPMQRPWQWDWARNRAASRPRVAPLYGLWHCAYQTGDWSTVSNHWPAIRTFYERHHPQANLWGTFGAHLAMARLAQALRDPGVLDIASTRARAAFAEGRDLERMVPRMRQAYRRHFDGFNDRGLAAGNWFFLDLTPEVGRFLADHVREPVLQRHRALLNAFPHWWVYRPWYPSGWTGHESHGLPPEILGMIFPVERWVNQAPPEVLASFQPQHAAHGIGDSHALEALALTLSAFGPDRWLDVRRHPAPPPLTIEGRPCTDLLQSPAP